MKLNGSVPSGASRDNRVLTDRSSQIRCEKTIVVKLELALQNANTNTATQRPTAIIDILATSHDVVPECVFPW